MDDKTVNDICNIIRTSDRSELVSYLDPIDIEYEIEVTIPSGYMNCGVTMNNEFIADSNNSSDYHCIKFPLPTPVRKWVIKS